MLVLTTFDLDEYAFGALRAGASGFRLKDLRRLLEEYSQVVPLSGADQALRYPQLSLLTTREREVLEAVSGGLSNAEIALTPVRVRNDR